MHRLPLLLIGLILPALLQANVYKWYDDEGNVYYGDRPPPEVKIHTIDGSTVSMVAADKINDAALSGGKVLIYTTQRCPHCIRAKQYMDTKHIPYTEKDVERSNKNHREFRELGGKGVPLIVVGTQKMSGFSEKNLEALLKKTGF